MNIDRPINSKVAATVIALFSLAITTFFLTEIDWSKRELNANSILTLLLFVVLITGFIFLALSIRGRNITSEETDNKIANTYKTIQQKLLPIWWVLAIGWLAWMGYLAWTLNTKV